MPPEKSQPVACPALHLSKSVTVATAYLLLQVTGLCSATEQLPQPEEPQVLRSPEVPLFIVALTPSAHPATVAIWDFLLGLPGHVSLFQQFCSSLQCWHLHTSLHPTQQCPLLSLSPPEREAQ